MYFDFEDYRPDIHPIGRAISWREGVLISIIAHLMMVIALLLVPRLFPVDEDAARRRALLGEALNEEPPRFVFVQPRRDRTAPRPPDRAEASDKNRMARAIERALRPADPLPFARGNSPERVEIPEEEPARARSLDADSAAEQRRAEAEAEAARLAKLPESQSALALPNARAPTDDRLSGRLTMPRGLLGDALRDLERYVRREAFDNPQGGGGQFGPEIQFDTKGVEFGPWIRRFVAQVKRNWLIPYAAMTMSGHVVITFNVHKDGLITDLTIVGPCPIEAFNNAAFGALAGSNPTYPLPPEYPASKAFFTVTFFYNEVPPR
jgi:TonB family protein